MPGFGAVGEFAVGEYSPPLTNVVEVPLAGLTIAGLAPTVGGGVTIAVPPYILSVGALAPIINTGAQVATPLASLTISAFAPKIVTGLSVQVPLANISLSAFSPQINTGATVQPVYGEGVIEYTDGAVGEFAVGEADVFGNLGDLRLSAFAPTINTGVAILTPVAHLEIQGLNPDIQARHRAVRIRLLSS